MIPMPDGVMLSQSPAALSVSPDGGAIVFAGVSRTDFRQLWLRPLDAAETLPIPHTEGALWPFWSPDGHSIGFYDVRTRQLKKTDLSGAQVEVVCDFAGPLGASWSDAGVILFGSTSGIYKVPASGGTPVAVTTVAAGEGSHQGPQVLPGGRHFLFTKFGQGLFAAAIDGSGQREIVAAAGNGRRLAGGDLLIVRGTSLIAEHLDIRRIAVSGDPVTVGTADAGTFAASASVLVYQQRRNGGVHALAWFDRTGRPAGILGDRADYSNLELSPDGTRIATAVLDPALQTRDIWIYDVARGIRQRFTFGAGEERTPVWSPDGKRLLFNSREKGLSFAFYQKAADGSGAEEPVLLDATSKDALGWSPDGRYLLYRANSAGTSGNDLWVLPAFGDRKPFPFAATPFDEQDGRISPDGRWAAYSTDESGQMEVYVVRFPSGGGKARVSAAGGSHPRWRRDGKELFYVSLDNQLMAAGIAGAGDDVRVGDAAALFRIVPPAQPGYTYDVSADGQRFIVNTDLGGVPALNVVLNWKPAK